MLYNQDIRILNGNENVVTNVRKSYTRDRDCWDCAVCVDWQSVNLILKTEENIWVFCI